MSEILRNFFKAKTGLTFVRIRAITSIVFGIVIGVFFIIIAVVMAYPKTVSNNLSSSLLSPIDVSGIFSVVSGDDFAHQKSEYFYYLKTGVGKEYALNFSKPPKEVKPNSKVRILGLMRDQNAKMPTVNVSTLEVTAPPQFNVNVLGDHRIATITTRFANGPHLDYGWDEVDRWIYSSNPLYRSLYNYVREVSFNQASVSGRLFGSYAIPIDFPVSGPCDYRYWGDLAKARAAADGFNENDYDHVFIGFPFIDYSVCPYSGFAEVCGRNMWGFGSPLSGLAEHELGHNFCAWHSNALNCTDGGERIAYSNSCTVLEYWDWFDIMGQSTWWNIFPSHHWNNYWKEIMDLLSPTNVQEVTTDGIYSLKPIEYLTTGVQALKIPRDDGTYFYLEFRQPSFFDDTFSAPYIFNGVTIRKTPTWGGTGLIDTTPLTQQPQGYRFYEDAPLAVGRLFEDRTNNPRISIITRSVSASGATVEIYFGHAGCIRSNPTIAVTPETQNGSPGQSLTYHVEIRNEDSSACSGSVFDLAANLPTELTQSPMAWRSNRLDPGETQSWDVQVTLSENPVNPEEETFIFTELATVSHGQDIYSANAQATYARCIQRAPTLRLTPSTQAGRAGNTLSYTPYIHNHDSSSYCSNSQFTLTIQLPDSNWINGGFSFPATLSIAPGFETTLPTITITSPNNASPGQFSFSITAADASNPGRLGNVSGIYRIITSSGPKLPVIEN